MRRREASLVGQQGFTLVEVMVSLGVMTIGAMALIAMQQQTTRANVRARDITMAMQIAQNVLERVKIDGVAWTTVAPAGTTQDLQNTQILRGIDGATPGSFIALPVLTASLNGETRPIANAFNYAGEDIDLSGASTAVQASVRYCASIRMTWVYTSRRAMRVDTRVWWSKEVPSRAITSDFVGCVDDNASLSPNGTYYDAYHIVYLSTVLRPTGT
jgi:prepilin-type N-terminal cleavage/methylation domain-containing protein